MFPLEQLLSLDTLGKQKKNLNTYIILLRMLNLIEWELLNIQEKKEPILMA